MSVSGRKRQGPRPSRVAHPDTPLTRKRLAAALTIPDLAERFGVSTATVARWLDGSRTAPAAFVRALQAAAVGNAVEIARAQEEYRQERRQNPGRPRLVLMLPPDVSEDEARRLCGKALAEAQGAAR